MESPLNNAIISTFRAALKFYRLNCGKGEEAKTANDFFNQNKLDKGFAKFWKSSKNPYKSKVKNYIEKFKDALDKVDIED